MTVFYQDEQGNWMTLFDHLPLRSFDKGQLRQRFAADLRGLLKKKENELNQGTTMSYAYDRNGSKVQPGDLVTVFNVPHLPELHGTVQLLVETDGETFYVKTESGDTIYTHEVEYRSTPEIADRKGYVVKVGDKVRVLNVPGLSRLNGTKQILTEVGATNRHGRFGFDLVGPNNRVYTNEVELIFDEEPATTNPPNGNGLMDKMTFAAEVLTYLQDERSREVYVADSDGDVFEIDRILFNPENGRIYLVRDYDFEVPSDSFIPANT